MVVHIRNAQVFCDHSSFMRTTMIRNRFIFKWVSVVVVAFFLVVGLTESKCAPSSCGDIHNISYPFQLKGDPNHCGKTPYTLECDLNNVTLLRLFSNDYRVKAIDYDYGTIRVVDPGLDKNTCSSLPRFPFSHSTDSSFRDWLKRSTFGLLSKEYILIFLKCANPVNSPGYVPTAQCISQSENMHGYVMVDYPGIDYTPSFSLEDLKNGCTVTTVHRMDLDYTSSIDIGNVSYKDMHSQMAEGFDLACHPSFGCGGQWKAYFHHGLYLCYPRTITGFFYLLIGPTFSIFGVRLSVTSLVISILLFVIGARFIFGSLFVAAFLIHKWRRRHWSAYNTIEDFLHTNNFMPIRYSYSNIKKMSNCFKHKLGSGGFGSVFKCKLRSGRFGAIKLLSNSKSNGEDFMSEVATIGRIHHVNVVQLVGYCVEGSKHALVYDFMPNGSLDKYIFSNNEESSITLSYKKIYEVAVGVAQGIEYLHQGCEMQILHFDIKPHNILLDENFVPKISDFGLAKLYPANNSIVSTMAARGTMGYIAPELFYKNIGAVSYKADVYSFGMLLMEMASRRKNLNARVDQSSQLYFPTWIHDQYNDGKDLEIGDDATQEEKILVRKMVVVALWCIQMRPNDRPSMKRVLQMLVGDVESLELPPKSSLCPQPTPVGIQQIPPACSSTVELTCTLSAR